MATVSNFQDVQLAGLNVPSFNFPPVQQKESNVMVEMAKGAASTAGTAVNVFPQVLSELNGFQTTTMKIFLEGLDFLEKKGMISIRKEEPVIVVEEKSSAGKGFAIGIGIILLLGAILL